MLDQLVGRSTVEPGRQPRLERRAADADPAAELAQDLVAVVVDGRAEDAQLDRRREQSDPTGRAERRRRRAPRRRPAQLDLVPRDEVAGRRPRRGRALGEADRQVRVGAGRNLARQRDRRCAERRDVGDLERSRLRRPRRRRATPTWPRAQSRPVNAWRFSTRSRAAPDLRHRDRSVDPGDLLHRRVRHEVRRHQPVGDEVAVVRVLAELPAVREAALAVREHGADAVVLPLPDEPALQPRGRQ